MPRSIGLATLLAAVALVARPAAADPFTFSTNPPDGRMAMASRPGPGPGGGVNQETEAADDFITTAPTTVLNSATFTGLLPAGVNLTPNTGISQVVVELYRVFPKDSDPGRTSGPPTFSTPQVPTRVNSPSDVALVSRDSTASGGLTFTATPLAANFTAQNSVDRGINPIPNQRTNGEGPVTGQEVRFDVTFTKPFELAPDHYFFVPQVLLSDPNNHFLWLSAPRLITGPDGTPFAPDLQAWIRNADLDPDWLRVGTDIVGGDPATAAPTFNAAFSLTGTAVPEPSSLFLLAAGGLVVLGRTAQKISRQGAKTAKEERKEES